MSHRRPALFGVEPPAVSPRAPLAFCGFVVGLAVVICSGDARQASAQPKAPVVPTAPQSPTINTPASFGAKVGEEN